MPAGRFGHFYLSPLPRQALSQRPVWRLSSPALARESRVIPHGWKSPAAPAAPWLLIGSQAAFEPSPRVSQSLQQLPIVRAAQAPFPGWLRRDPFPADPQGLFTSPFPSCLVPAGFFPPALLSAACRAPWLPEQLSLLIPCVRKPALDNCRVEKRL